MKLLLTIALTIAIHLAYGQSVIPSKVIISKGKCTEECGYTNGFENLEFYNRLEFDIENETTHFQKKANKKAKLIKFKSEEFDSYFAMQLDSIVDNFETLKFSRGKYSFYKLELVYVLDQDLKLPIKKKTVVFWISTNPTKVHPPEIDTLIDEYHKALGTR